MEQEKTGKTSTKNEIIQEEIAKIPEEEKQKQGFKSVYKGLFLVSDLSVVEEAARRSKDISIRLLQKPEEEYEVEEVDRYTGDCRTVSRTVPKETVRLSLERSCRRTDLASFWRNYAEIIDKRGKPAPIRKK